MQDLIYLNGQSNIKEASVSIVFDNSEKSKSPPGFQECETITVTRKIAVRNAQIPPHPQFKIHSAL